MKKLCFFLLAICLTGTACEEIKPKEGTNKLQSCNPQTEFIREENNIETIIVMSKEQTKGHLSYIGLGQLPGYDAELTAFFIQGMAHNRICNYPQWAKDWEIPENGLPVIISGKIYQPSYNPGFYTADKYFTDMELTSIKKK